jgi:dTDP-4-amino-4,6-dideoxygalactose transaminase
VPEVRPGCRHVFHLFAVRSEGRDAARAYLAARGIQTGVHYPVPVHLHEAFRSLGYRAGDFPVSEELARTVISLPMYAELTEAQLDEVCGGVREFARPPAEGHRL